MSEQTTDTNPNINVLPSPERQIRDLITTILDDPEALGATVQDGSYTKTDSENKTDEKLAVTQAETGIAFNLSRSREDDPNWNVPGKSVETLTAFVVIPSIAQASVMTVGGKLLSVEYSDPSGSKSGDEGVEAALEAMKFAIDELQPRQ